MKTRALNECNDIFLNGNRISVNQDAEQVAQKVKTKLLFYRGEWFLDITIGVPYFQQVFVKPALIGTIESLIKSQIINTEGVNKLTSFSSNFDRNDRKFSVSFTAETVYGEIRKDISISSHPCTGGNIPIVDNYLALVDSGYLLLNDGNFLELTG